MGAMRHLLAVLTCLMLFTTPVVAGNGEDEEWPPDNPFKIEAPKPCKELLRKLLINEYRTKYVRPFQDAYNAFIADEYEYAIRLYNPHAEQGRMEAQHMLGRVYEMGTRYEFINLDAFDKAIYWYRKAAEQGDARAQYRLGLMNLNGWGVPESDAKAIYWYRKAAEQGNMAAAQEIGAILYNDGKGNPQNYAEAYAWFSVYAARGDVWSTVRKDAVKDLMTYDQIAKGQELAAEYWEKYVVPCPK
jgi:TPR repeat protein